jgi:hypothetical protein
MLQSCFNPGFTPLDCCLLGWMEREAYKTKVDAGDELLARILNNAACIKKHKKQTRRKKKTGKKFKWD